MEFGERKMAGLLIPALIRLGANRSLILYVLVLTVSYCASADATVDEENAFLECSVNGAHNHLDH